MAGLVAAARARELGAAPVVLREGRPAGRLDAALERRDLAAPNARRLPRGVPGRRPGAAGAGSSRSSTTRSTGSSRLGIEPVRARDRQPAARSGAATTRARSPTCSSAPPATCGCEEPFREAQVLATGGFGARLARERGLLLRAAPWSEGDGLATASRRGAGRDGGDGRVLRARAARARWRRTSSCAHRSSTRATRSCSTTRARDLGEAAWHESDIVQRFPAGRRGTWSTPRAASSRCGSGRWPTSSRPRARRAATSGRRRSCRSRCPRRRSSSSRRSWRCGCYAGVTHTIGGLRIDDRARVLDGDGAPVPDLYAAGADAGGIFTGGYGSGLAAALVYGRIAAETALALGELRVAQRRRSPGSGDGPILLTRSSVSSASTVEPTGRRPRRRAAAASSRWTTRRRARSPPGAWWPFSSSSAANSSRWSDARRRAAARRGSRCRRPLPARPRSGRSASTRARRSRRARPCAARRCRCRRRSSRSRPPAVSWIATEIFEGGPRRTAWFSDSRTIW